MSGVLPKSGSFQERNTDTELQLAYDGLIYHVFRRPQMEHNRGVVVAFTSATSGEGVTYVISRLMHVLDERQDAEAVSVSSAWLKDESSNHRSSTAGHQGSHRGLDQRRLLVDQLRAKYEYTAIDCPAIGTSGDVLSLAPLMDGVVLIVEADATKKAQVRNADRQIRVAGGKLLGTILNKRRYPVPKSLYNFF